MATIDITCLPAVLSNVIAEFANPAGIALPGGPPARGLVNEVSHQSNELAEVALRRSPGREASLVKWQCIRELQLYTLLEK